MHTEPTASSARRRPDLLATPLTAATAPRGLSGAGIAAVLAGAALAGAFFDAGSKPPAPVPSVALAAATARHVQGPWEEEWRRRAVQVLLVPLLDVDAARFAQPTLRHPCLGEADVEVDGRPYPAGASLPGRPFVVRWRMDGCMPLGTSWLELSGEVALAVEPTGSGWHVTATPTHLVAAAGHLRQRLTASVQGDLAAEEGDVQ